MRNRILFAAPFESADASVRALKAELARSENVLATYFSVASFWHMRHQVDIVHVFFPEDLIVEGFLDADGVIENLRIQLEEWRKQATVVATVSHRPPRDDDEKRFYYRIYETVYTLADGLIHMGLGSLIETQNTFPKLAGKLSTVIPAGLTARPPATRAAVAPDVTTYATYGFDAQDTDDWQAAFQALPGHGLHLAAGGWHNVPVSPHTDESVTAQVVVLGPEQAFNLASVAAGFMSGAVVIGPGDGNTGSILRSTANPTYQAGQLESMVAALTEAKRLVSLGHGTTNMAYAAHFWNIKRVAKDHLHFYKLAHDTAREWRWTPTPADAQLPK